MDLRGYLRAIRKGWWIVLVVTLLGAGEGVLANERATPIYAGHVTFYVSTPSSTGNSSALSADQFAQDRANSYVQLLSSERLARAIIAATRLNLTAGQVMGEITGTAQLNTVLVKATVKDPTPSRALRIASALATQFPAMVDVLDNRGTGASTVVLNVVSGPSVGHSPISPHKKLNLGLGILIGLVLGVAAALLREVMNTTVRSVEALRAVSGAPVIGTIGFEGSARKSPLVVDRRARSIRAEAFRQLRTNLQFIDAARPANVIVVTSSVVAEGKSSTAANLAITFAEAGRRVLLIEADMRRPRIAEYLGVEGAVGLTNVLVGEMPVADVLQQWGGGGLSVLPSGPIPPNPSELLGSGGMRELLAALRQDFETIILDTPPLLPVTDAAVASVLADGVVLVVRYGKTHRAKIASAVRSLQSVDARLLGCVLNMVPTRRTVRRGRDGYGYFEDVPDTSAANAVDEGEPSPGEGGPGNGHRPAGRATAPPTMPAGAALLKPFAAVRRRTGFRRTPQ
jgi:capsular exopolysaccharide synthesis family protein